MRLSNQRIRSSEAGFTLPAILVVTAALLILAVGVLLVAGIERHTARSFVDRQRAELAARAGLGDVKGILTLAAANDDFVILQDREPSAGPDAPDPVSYLYLARGSGGGKNVNFRYLPLFSTEPMGSLSGGNLAAPKAGDLIGGLPQKMVTLPWQAPVAVTWIGIADEKGSIVSRYAFWVEDLQSRVDARTAGNAKEGGSHKRYGWKAGDTSATVRFPAPGLNAEPSCPSSNGKDMEPPLDQVALYALDPAAGARDESDFDKTLMDGRETLVSPDSVLAAAGIEPPLTREGGHLIDARSRACEENLSASVRPYDEQPVVPYAYGIDASLAGRPKLNLNALLAKPAGSAVDEMAAWIGKGLPAFESRKGGFPEDYLKTLAASAIGYAAPDNKPVVRVGAYRGLGKSPMISEIVLDINYLGSEIKDGNRIMNYEFILFAELLNHTNLPIEGRAALSYEVGYHLPGMGASPEGSRFDDSSLLDDPVQCDHDLVKQGGRYWSTAKAVSLAAGEYKFFKFAAVNYRINIGSAPAGQQFTLSEPLGAAGLSMKWNGKEVERIPSVIRSSSGLTFHGSFRKYFGKAAIPGHGYGPFGEFINNMGDPRIAHFIRFEGGGISLSENSFPENISPNRRNVRYQSIYSSDGPTKQKTFGRVIPSEWPDGGHDAGVSPWNSGWSDKRKGYEGGKTKPPKHGDGPAFDPANDFPVAAPPEPGEALTYLSDRGRYYSATELGRLYDPVMFLPTFAAASGLDSTKLRGNGEPSRDTGIMPAAGVPWPLVQVANSPSPYFGGGNTLRIGRPEHPLFDQPRGHEPSAMPATHAARLLDLFHAGKSRSADPALREGPLVRIEGHVNINTATRDTLRALAAGVLEMDPKLSRRVSDEFDGRMAPPIQPLSLSAPTGGREADRIADAIILGRPYASPSELACAKDADGKPVFGNPDFYPEKEKIQWSDAAAEEIFGRVYEAATVRSRNFRVWVVGQAVSPTAAGNPEPEVLAEVRKVFTIFADPGARQSDGGIDPAKSRVIILHENDF